MVDTCKALIPFQNTARAIWRRLSPYTTDAGNDVGLVIDAITLAAEARPAGKVVLEFGSGWNPILPLVFRLAGATRVILTDQERLLDRGLLLQAIDAIGAEWPRVQSSLDLPDGAVKLLQVNRTRPLADLLSELGMQYLAPFDPTLLPPHSVDLVVSRCVLEHVSEPVLTHMLAEFGRVLVDGGSMLHRIDMSDHWEHKDKSISRVNFLRYGEGFWRLTNLNPQNVQNRLRRADYVKLIARAGFGEITATGVPDAASLYALQDLPLAQRFRSMSHEELAIIETTVSARIPVASCPRQRS